jgi:hypothetical protein
VSKYFCERKRLRFYRGRFLKRWPTSQYPLRRCRVAKWRLFFSSYGPVRKRAAFDRRHNQSARDCVRWCYCLPFIVYHSGTHFTGIGKCAGSKAVQLFGWDEVTGMPFINPTPNPGGEYKVWMTPIASYSYDPTKGFHGFIPSKSKTDNFKVAPPVENPCPIGFEC